jgi:hypothetical protein
MLGVIMTTWLLLQLPAGMAVGRFIACPARAKRVEPSEARRKTLARAA